MKRILVVEVNWLGDCIMSLPIFKAIKESIPGCSLGVVVPERVAPLFEHNPFIDNVFVFDERTSHKSIAAKRRIIRQLKQHKFDTAFFIHRSMTRMLVCLCAGIKRRIGYRRLKTRLFLTETYPAPKKQEAHRSEYYFDLFRQVGITITDTIPHIVISEKERTKVQHFLAEYRKKGRFLVALNPSSNWQFKSWPEEHFISLIEKLFDLNCTVFLIGTKDTYALASSIQQSVSKEIVNLCGKTNLRELAAFLSSIDVLVSADSGPAHLASAVDTETVVLFGPTSPRITQPLGKTVHVVESKHTSCQRPCYTTVCRDNKCMQSISPQEVLLMVKEIVQQ